MTMITYERYMYPDTDTPLDIYYKRLYKENNGIEPLKEWLDVGRYFNVNKDNMYFCSVYWSKPKRCWKIMGEEIYHINRDALIFKYLLYTSTNA